MRDEFSGKKVCFFQSESKVLQYFKLFRISNIPVLFKRLSLWSCPIIWEAQISIDNVRMLVFRDCSVVASKASFSTTEGLPDLSLSSRLVSPSLKRLNKFYAARSLIIPGPSTSYHCSCTQSLFYR